MNIVVRSFSYYRAVLCHNGVRSIVGGPLRPYHNASRASAPTSTLAGKGTARTRPRAYKARAEREKAHHGHQEKCQSGTTCARRYYYPVSPCRFLTKRCAITALHRTHAKLWRRTWSARVVMFKSSTRCARNCRRSDCASRHYAATSKWPKPCAVPLVFAVCLPSPPFAGLRSRLTSPPTSIADGRNVNLFTGDEKYEPGTQPPADPAHHERL